MYFENLLYKGSNFLDTYNDDDHLILPTYTKGGSGLTLLASPTPYVHELWDLLPTMPPLVNIGWDSSQMKPIPAHATACKAKCTTISFRNVHCITAMNRLGISSANLSVSYRAFCFLDNIGYVGRMESSNYSGDKWWPTHWVIQQILIDGLIGKRDLERSKKVP